MTDKLAEAIADFNDAFSYDEDNKNHVKKFDGRTPDIYEYWREFDIILGAARAYNDLPVVDVAGITQDIDESEAIDLLDSRQACKSLLKYLQATYPNGLKLKND